jgi:hypothetical protein
MIQYSFIEDKINNTPITDILNSLCQNPNAIHIVEQHQDILDNSCWKELLMNPSIFSTDTMSYVFK